MKAPPSKTDKTNHASHSQSHTNTKPTPLSANFALTPRPTAEQLMMMQRTIGNQATIRYLAAASNSVQRDYLDQTDKTGALTNATKNLLEENDKIDDVLEALGAYQKANSGMIDMATLVDSVTNLLSVVQRSQSEASKSLKPILKHLEKEAQIVHKDIIIADGFMYAANKPEWGTEDSEQIATALRELNKAVSKYDPKAGRTGKSKQQGVWFVLNEAIIAVGRKEEARIYQLSGLTRERMTDMKRDKKEIEEDSRKLQEGTEKYNYGDSKTGVISEENKGYLQAFSAMKEFLANKSLVLAHLQPLAIAIQKADDQKSQRWKLKALKTELTRKEQEAGFAAPKVPLGILPGDVFVSLLRDGTVLDDFGAGLQHGELSHRIQWYAVIDYMQGEGKSNELLKPYTPLQLFKKINSEGFSPNRQGNTMWGSVLDAGTSAFSNTYSAPGTLNRDLLDTVPGYKEEGFKSPGNAERTPPSGSKEPGKYAYPPSSKDTKGLEPIGEALIELRNYRIEQASKVVPKEKMEGKEGEMWQKYGAPPPELVSHIEETLSKEGGFKVSDQGEMDDTGAFSSGGERKQWKVLQEMSK